MSTETVRFKVEQRLVAMLDSKTNIILPEGYRVVGYTIVPMVPYEALPPAFGACLHEDNTQVIPLPWVWDADGDLVPYRAFLIDFLPEAVRLLWMGDTALRVGRLVNGHGIEFPLPGSDIRLPPGAEIVVTHKAPTKVKGTGVLMRGGRVVRDTPATPDEAAQDRAVERSYAARGADAV